LCILRFDEQWGKGGESPQGSREEIKPISNLLCSQQSFATIVRRPSSAADRLH